MDNVFISIIGLLGMSYLIGSTVFYFEDNKQQVAKRNQILYKLIVGIVLLFFFAILRIK